MKKPQTYWGPDVKDYVIVYVPVIGEGRARFSVANREERKGGPFTRGNASCIAHGLNRAKNALGMGGVFIPVKRGSTFYKSVRRSRWNNPFSKCFMAK